MVLIFKCRDALLFRSLAGGFFTENVFRNAWYRACDAVGVKGVRPYALRHTFVANCEVLGIPKFRLISLMGHVDKSMIDRVYGKYHQGIEHKAAGTLAYYGTDFVNWKNETATPFSKRMAVSWESFGKVKT